jgi:ElaB/YqjD/DUF883 family membrane-anchored ribosome-binding protein
VLRTHSDAAVQFLHPQKERQGMDEQKDAGRQKCEAPPEVPSPAPPQIDPTQPLPNSNPEEKDREDKQTKSSTISDIVMVCATCVIAAGTLVSAWAIGLQWREMVGGGTQTDQIIGAANAIKADQNQLVLDNKQALADNRQALSDVLRENREELTEALQQNREALQTQTNAYNGQLAAIQSQTEAAQRPWLDAEITEVGPVIYNANGPTIAFTIRVRNKGHSPAVNTNISPKIINRQNGPSVDEQKKLCLEGRPRAMAWGQTIFPEGEWAQYYGIPMDASEVNNSKSFVSFREGDLLPQIIGCVSYFSPSSPVLHHTFLSYDLVNLTEGGDGAFPVNVPVAAGRVRADKQWVGVPPAD